MAKAAMVEPFAIGMQVRQPKARHQTGDIALVIGAGRLRIMDRMQRWPGRLPSFISDSRDENWACRFI